ncbi:MBL fold metallo-hydrolase [Paraliobacillus ryukyuensis]|uniref:MBL fold metallo-hydrolase n=1 Tax=Paraliobacillus ryukyuensis TaxID=200904 RepID=UPI0009A6C2CA|nr:MBL fold metallo-hydrolase [Paraliobacillus ryukyuensis]
MIKITALGVGGAFTEKYYHNNYIFDFGERRMLVDAGTTIRYSLKESDYELNSITDILITHLHSDHVGGLEEIGQRCKFILNHKPNLWIREDQYREFRRSLNRGLETDGFTLLSYFNVCLFNIEEGFNIDKYKIVTIRTDHYHAKGMKSFGFKVIQPNNSSILFTGDIAKIYEKGLIWHIDDKTAMIFHDCSIVSNPVHASINEIRSYYGHELMERIYMMHYQDDTDVELMEKINNCNFVRQGEEYIL